MEEYKTITEIYHRDGTVKNFTDFADTYDDAQSCAFDRINENCFFTTHHVDVTIYIREEGAPDDAYTVFSKYRPVGKNQVL